MTICTDVKCPRRMECQQFMRALDVNSGKRISYEKIECKGFSHYER